MLNRMGEDSKILRGSIARLFEKIAKWIGLSSNAGPILAALFIEKYKTGNRLSSEDLCRATGYSRANAGLIISQLEGLGVIEGQRDYSQTGRGRKRLLYTIHGGFADIFQLGILSIHDRLESMMSDITHIEGTEDPRFSQMLKDMRNVIDLKRSELQGMKQPTT